MDQAERTGLGVAIIGHAALFVALSLSLLSPPTLPKIESDPIEVQLIEDVAEVTRAPEPQTAPTPPAAAEPSPPPPPVPIAPPEPPRPIAPAPAPRPEPRPVPKPVAAPAPRPVPKPVPKPIPKPLPKPMAKPAPRLPAKPLSQADRRRPDKGTLVPPANRPRLANPNSGLGDAMRNLRNPAPGAVPGPARPNPAPRPAAAVKPGPPAIDATAVKRALGSEIGRQLKPRWKAPTGADVDQLVTILSWDLAQDGSLSGAPRFVSQSGVTPSNAAQAEVHRENAIKAVRAAAPFKLPSEHYAYWKSVVSFRFDKRLSQ
jgi:hypothetical protein